MKQFEIRRLRSGDLVLLLQHDLLEGLNSLVVAPVVRMPSLLPMQRLRPTFDVDSVRHVILTDRLAAVERSAIGTVVADARDVQDAVNLALDFLFKGF